MTMEKPGRFSGSDDRPDDEVTGALRARYVAPDGDAYWDALASRILTHVTSHATEAVDTWWGVVAQWARPGVAAAAIAAIAAGVIVAQTRALEWRAAAYEAVIELPPDSAPLRPTAADSARTRRAATLEYILSR